MSAQPSSASETGPPPSDQDLEYVLRDFVQDVVTTFPETKEGLDPDLATLLESQKGDDCTETVAAVRTKLAEVYPSKFFDILYQNEELFDQTTELFLLPGIDFRPLWTSNITDATRQTMWKYLQLVLFTLVASMKDGASFGDTAKLFEAIDPEEFRGKLEETISEMQSCFEGEENGEEGDDQDGTRTADSIPDPESLHEHVKGMMGGKLGQLAHEIAEEAARDLGIDPDMKNPRAAFQTLLKDPMKLMGLVKKVGGKLNDKIKSGEIKEAELLKEATEIVQRMRDMPGMGGIESLLRRKGGGKPDLGAMQAHLQRNSKMASQRDRMRAKLASRQKSAEPPTPAPSQPEPTKKDKCGKKKRRKKKKAK